LFLKAAALGIQPLYLTEAYIGGTQRFHDEFEIPPRRASADCDVAASSNSTILN